MTHTYTICCIETDGSPAPIPPSSSMGLARTIQRNLEKARTSSPVKRDDSTLAPVAPVVVAEASFEASAVSEVTTSTLTNGTTRITEVSADITATTSTGTNGTTANGSVHMAPAVTPTPVVPIPTAGLSFSERTDLFMSGVMDQMALLGLAQSQQKQAQQSEQQQQQQQSAQQDGESPLPPTVPESEPDLLIEDTGRTSTSSYMSYLFDQDPPPPITPIAPVMTTPTRRMNTPSPSPSDVTTSSYINDNTIIDPPLGGPIVPTFTPIFTPKDDKVVLTPAAKESLTAANNATLNECKLSNHRANAGCAAIVVLKVNNILYIANAGDSRAVLCRAGGVAYSLSHDHKPYEVSRV